MPKNAVCDVVNKIPIYQQRY